MTHHSLYPRNLAPLESHEFQRILKRTKLSLWSCKFLDDFEILHLLARMMHFTLLELARADKSEVEE